MTAGAIISERLEQLLASINLERGAHPSVEDGMCALEAAAWIVGKPHTDYPPCVSAVLGAFLRNWNDSVDDAFRQKLKTFIPRIIGTANDGLDERRAWMATDWLVRVCAPAWLDLAKLTQHAMALRTADEITNSATAIELQPKINAAWDAAWDAARAAARAAAGDAARDAARAAARAAAGDAAGDAACAAAGDAAWAAARAAAWDAACAAARAAAWAAARAAAWDAACAAARDAAWAAARDVLKPTVEQLQASALELLDRMISPDSAEEVAA